MLVELPHEKSLIHDLNLEHGTFRSGPTSLRGSRPSAEQILTRASVHLLQLKPGTRASLGVLAFCGRATTNGHVHFIHASISGGHRPVQMAICP